ncbi:MAG: nuclear transport factor 2 family protein [Vicinamibacterales bacterium]
MADSFREAMELLAKETRELREIIGPPVVPPPVPPAPPTPADRGRAITTVAVSVAGAAVAVVAAMALAGIPVPGTSTAPASTPQAIASRRLDITALMRVDPPALAAAPVARPGPRAVAATLPPTVREPSAPVASAPTRPPAPAPNPVAAPPTVTTAAPAAAPATAPATTGTVAPSVRAEILENHDRWFAAYAASDQARLAQLEADGFRMLDMRPPADRVTRGGAVERSLEGIDVEISGDALVLSARMTERPPDGTSVVSALSEVWTPSGTGWRLLGIVIRPAAP